MEERTEELELLVDFGRLLTGRQTAPLRWQ